MGRIPTAALSLAAVAVLCSPQAVFAQKAAAKVPAVNLFEDASDVPVQIRKAVAGKVMISELTLSDDYVEMQIQDPKRKENLDEYTYRDGKIGEPIPVKISGDYTQEDLDASLFPLESVDFGLVPTMILDAKQRLKMPDGKAGILTLKRGWPFHNEVRWMVSVSDARHTGMVQYDLKGRKKEVHKQ
jgi:hypothetical protein